MPFSTRVRYNRLHEREWQTADGLVHCRTVEIYRTMGVANNALTRPAVFWIVEKMKKRSEARKPKNKRKRRL